MSQALNLESNEIRDYLLRRLSEAAADRIEKAYFENDGLLERIEAEEDRMIAEYVLGNMPESDRKRFENSLLGAPYYRERVETTRKLKLQHLEVRSEFSRRGRFRDLSKDPKSSPHGHIFPGRTGWIVAVSLLTLLFVSAVVSAVYLKSQVRGLASELESLKETHAGPSLDGISILDAGTLVGPPWIHVRFSSEGTAAIVLPPSLLSGIRETDALVLLDGGGNRVWSSPLNGVDGANKSQGLVLRLPKAAGLKGTMTIHFMRSGDEGDHLYFLSGIQFDG